MLGLLGLKTFLLSLFLHFYCQNMEGCSHLRNVVGNVQPNLYIRDMKKFKIPILPQSFQLQIEQIVKSAHQNKPNPKTLP